MKTFRWNNTIIMINKFILILVSCIFSHEINYGQSHLTGKIIDYHNLEPTPGIAIINQFDSTMFLTDTSGIFTIPITQNDSVFKLTGIGYGTTVIKNMNCTSNINLGKIPVFEYTITGGTIEVGNKKNIFGKHKRKQPIICNDWVTHDSIGRDGIFLWNNGQKKITLVKKGSILIIDLSETICHK
jgi:hypothetical protein